MFLPRRIAMASLVLFLGLGCLVLAGGGSSVPPAELTRLIEQDAKFLQDTLAKSKLDKKTGRKIKGTALMVAAYAQVGMSKDNAPAMATLRDTALKLIKAADADDLSEAKKLAAALSASPKADAAANPAPVAFNAHLELELVMRQFSSERIGGFGMEGELETLVEMKGAAAGAQKDKVLALANKITVIADVARFYPPEKDEPKGKTKANWLGFTDSLRTQAQALADAARTGKDIGTAADNLSKACTKCHDVFR